MERGPLTLFGAILAIGLGPSLWLGAQLGTVNVSPSERPSTVGEQFPESDVDFGGTGAGSTTDQADPIVRLPAPAVSSRTSGPVATVPSSPSSRVTFKPPASSAIASPSAPAPSSAAPPSAGPPASPSASGGPDEPDGPSESPGTEPGEQPEPSDPPVVDVEPSAGEPGEGKPGDDEGEGSLRSPLLVANS